MTFGILDVELRIDRWIRFTASVHFDWDTTRYSPLQ